MKLSDFDFPLPAERIARVPAPHRDHSRLMVVERASGRISHAVFSDLPGLLAPTDFLVVNDSRVVPARLLGRIKERAVESLLTRFLDDREGEALCQPARHFRFGAEIDFGEGLNAVVTGVLERGRRRLRFNQPAEAVRRHGYAPLPPYIKRRRQEAEELRHFDLDRYQTVYADEPGSIAAPTAGLHFTPQLMAELERSHEIVHVTLAVGEATFQKIDVEEIGEHRMGTERVRIPRPGRERISALKAEGRKLLAVGTTSVRSLESWAALKPEDEEFTTDLFIFPGFRFQLVDKMVTNFHLPRSSLFILVSALAGLDLMREAYRIAVEKEYRFFSYGDAMLIR
jgi:S-adenosylmethionine:tRNA ribosyltransferase-isomerase